MELAKVRTQRAGAIASGPVRSDGSWLRQLTCTALVRTDGKLVAVVRFDAGPKHSFTDPGREMFIDSDGIHLSRLQAPHLPAVRLVGWR